MALIDDAKKHLGELFITGFNGLELEDDTAAFLSQARIGGVILFQNNYENPGQLAELTNQIQECRTELPLWISTDHEGGKVQRFKKPFTKIPDAATIGTIESSKTVFDIADVLAKELNAVGVNLNFCPVADILTNPKNQAIGTRSYGTDEDRVSRSVTAMVRGHMVNKVQPCVKHFPGHGEASTDSHFALPKVDTPLETLRNREFRTFVRAFKSRCSMVMTGHLLMTAIDPKFPATLSPTLLRDILRTELRYNRIIITDDMEMKAIADHFGPEEAPRLAIEAGCDILLYRTEAGARQAYAALDRALESGTLDPEVVLEAAGRSRSLKEDSLLPYKPIKIAELSEKIGTPESAELIERAVAQASS